MLSFLFAILSKWYNWQYEEYENSFTLNEKLFYFCQCFSFFSSVRDGFFVLYLINDLKIQVDSLYVISWNRRSRLQRAANELINGLVVPMRWDGVFIILCCLRNWGVRVIEGDGNCWWEIDNFRSVRDDVVLMQLIQIETISL